VNWAKGKLLREYTVLLDPPVVAPTRTAPPPTPVREPPAAQPAAKIAAEPAKPKPTPTRVKPPHPVAEAKPAAPAPAPTPAKPKAAPHAAANGEYGPVAEGETLTEIARSTRPDDATNINEMMLALLKANPNAFYKDNINALRRGAILRIPSRDDVKATGSVAEAAAAVHEQNQAWATKVPVSKPTVVATTGTPKKTAEPPAAKPAPAKAGEHLTLVPPAAGKGGQGASDRPGTASGTAGGTESKAELARVKESLVSREQEVSELKSRVKDLEKINDDDKRLLTLKQNEVADLQKKLKELEAKAAIAAAAKPATTAPAPTAAAPAPAKPAETPAVSTTKPAEPAKPAESAKPAEAGKAPSNLTAKDIWGNISAGGQTKPTPAASTPPAATAPAPNAATAPPAASAPPPTASAPSPSATAPSAGTATTPSSTTPAAAKPETTQPTSTATPLKPTTAPKVAPIAPPPAELPWWQKPEYLYGGGIGLLLIGLFAFMRLMRKPKAELPVVPVAAHADAVDEEHHLLDELRRHPGDPQLSLQLLSLYYANRDAHKFEAAAETMYAHIADPTQPEWQEVRAMGEDLVPNNPLFGGHEDIAQAAGTGWPHHEHATEHAAEHSEAETHAVETHGHDQDFDLGPFDTRPANKAMPEESFDFDLTDHTATAHAAPAAAAAHPTPPPPAYTPPAPAYTPPAPAPKPAAMPASPAPKPAEDFFAGEDAIGTKLDLAKAYLDMGDPEGARSMLDEVMNEGNDAQKGEARKLLAEIK
jgi:pilus assembly protein FimV